MRELWGILLIIVISFLYISNSDYPSVYLLGILNNKECPFIEAGGGLEDLNFPVSKIISLKTSYVPPHLVDISDKVKSFGLNCLRKEILPNLEAMFRDAKESGHELAVTSAWRSYDEQKSLYNYWKKIESWKYKDEVAPVGHSEHQLGVAVDLTSKSIKWKSVAPEFADSKEYKWLEWNAYKYGFIFSYPKDKKDKTKYNYEPWHLRFVGIEAAKEIHTNELVFLDYFRKQKTSEEIISKSKLDNDLHEGLANENIKYLQSILKIEGAYSGEIDGVFGTTTRNAVIAFQKKYNFYNIPDTGYVGPYTRSVINELYFE